MAIKGKVFETNECSTKCCIGKLKAYPNNKYVETNGHNHSRILDSEITTIEIKQKIKEKALIIPCEPKDIYILETNTFDLNERKDLGNYKSLCRTIGNIKIKHSNASLVNDYDIPSEYLKTLSGHKFN